MESTEITTKLKEDDNDKSQDREEREKEKTDSNGEEQQGESSESDDSTAEQTEKQSVMEQEREAYANSVKSNSKSSVAEKLKNSEPFRFFLSVIAGDPRTADDKLALQFSDLLDPELGDIESSLQITFTVEIGWLLAQYDIKGHRKKPITLLYGAGDPDLCEIIKTKSVPHLTPVKVHVNNTFGHHHTKMMVLYYKDKSIRVIVTTGNLTDYDWHNLTQGIWISERLKFAPENSEQPTEPRGTKRSASPDPDDSSPEEDPMKQIIESCVNDSPTGFKKDLLRYLHSYDLPQLKIWLLRILDIDFQPVNVFFVASIPGKRPIALQEWGQKRMKHILSNHLTIEDDSINEWPVVCQCSSIGSLGPYPNKWLLKEFVQNFSSCKGRVSGTSPTVKVIYPSIDTVVNSIDGILGSACLPYRSSVHATQIWLNSFMCQWKSDSRFRTTTLPHTKTYCRISPDGKRMAWFLLTSANLSKAAWGWESSATSNLILSYEAGVLFLPEFLGCKSDTFPLVEDENEGDKVFPLPYDLPLVPYTETDHLWLSN